MGTGEWLVEDVVSIDLVSLSARVIDGCKCFIFSDRPARTGRRRMHQLFYAHSFQARTYERFWNTGIKLKKTGSWGKTD